MFFTIGCNCDITGSESSLCDKYTGQCPCKSNVGGRTCDRCQPGFYGFGADGCLPCNCHAIGSLNPFCRNEDGQCDCAENAYGRECNECQPGMNFWRENSSYYFRSVSAKLGLRVCSFSLIIKMARKFKKNISIFGDC